MRLMFSRVALVVGVLLGSGPVCGQAPPDSDAAERLIRQLGSRKFREREQAAKALEALGEPALDALKRAAEKSDDPEVRLRARQLFETLEDRLCVEVRRFQLPARGFLAAAFSPTAAACSPAAPTAWCVCGTWPAARSCAGWRVTRTTS